MRNKFGRGKLDNLFHVFGSKPDQKLANPKKFLSIRRKNSMLRRNFSAPRLKSFCRITGWSVGIGCEGHAMREQAVFKCKYSDFQSYDKSKQYRKAKVLIFEVPMVASVSFCFKTWQGILQFKHKMNQAKQFKKSWKAGTGREQTRRKQDWCSRGLSAKITKIGNNKSKQANKQTSQQGEDEETTRRIVREPAGKQEEGKATTRRRD